jgi:hypothetical protein
LFKDLPNSQIATELKNFFEEHGKAQWREGLPAQGEQ